MGSISLESSIRTCKVDSGWASKIESDRFLNPDNMVCPMWNGLDTAGRRACPDSFMTKRAGCNSAEDRVMVENNVTRPQYMEYLNLNAAGIAADVYGPYKDTAAWKGSGCLNQFVKDSNAYHGQFGLVSDFSGNLTDRESQQGNAAHGSKTAYAQTMAQMNQMQRQKQAAVERYQSQRRRGYSGF